jgi:alcohol dehydrogenase
MKTRAAVLTRTGAAAPYADSRPLEIWEVDLAPPGPGEVLVKVAAAGVPPTCPSSTATVRATRPSCSAMRPQA